LQGLEAILRPDLWKQLQAAAAAQGGLRMQSLKELGLDAVFDEGKLELRVAVPAELRRPSDIRFFGNGLPPEAKSALRPSDFSAYLNLRSGFDYVEQSASRQNGGLQPLNVNVEGAVNLHNLVVEGSASYTQNAATPLTRDDVRLVYDDPPRMIRYSLGDLSYPVSGFQSFEPLLGLTVARNFSLQPYRITQPLGQTSFFLKSPSKVEVLLNGQPVQTLQLPAGPQNLHDFRFVNGANEVNLRITDEVGRIETLHLSYLFDNSLLAEGLQEFAYSAGLPSLSGEGGPEYEARLPGFSAFHRVGLTDQLTAGLNLQGNNDQQMFGANAVWATDIGTFQPDAALSHVEGAGGDYSMRLAYRYANPLHIGGSVFSLSAQYSGARFAPLGNLDPSNSVSGDFSASFSHALPWRMYAGVGGNYQISRYAQPDTSGVNFTFGKRFGRDVSLDLTLDRRQLCAGRPAYSAFLSLVISFPTKRQTARFTQDTSTGTTRGEWQYSALNPVGGLDGSLGAQSQRGVSDVLGGLRYNDYRSEMSLSQDVTTPSSPTANVDNRTSFRLGTALVFADGDFGLSRPVQDSFAIVVPHPELAGQDIGVDRVRDTYAARTDWLGPAVVPDLSSYRVRKMTIDAPDLPLGYELGPSDRTVWPTYKSGTVIRVGTGATVLLRGVLETAKGAPVSLQSGQIVFLDEPGMPPIEVFTNRKGKFMAEGLKPGTFELRLLGDAQPKVRFVIPKGKAGLYDIGSLALPAEAPSESGTNNTINKSIEP
jgi:outer membrane usher protein